MTHVITLRTEGLVSTITVILTLVGIGSSLRKKVNAIVKDLKGHHQDILKLIVTNNDMPLHERIRAGEEYVGNGGNGEISKLVNKLKKQEREEQGL